MTDSVNVSRFKDMLKRRFRPRTLVVGAVLGCAFIFMASIFAPDTIQAGEEIERAPLVVYSAETTDDLTPIGTLEAAGMRIEIFGTDHGTVYSVFDNRGLRLAELISADELSAQFPELDIRGAQADVPLRVMGTDVGGGGW